MTSRRRLKLFAKYLTKRVFIEWFGRFGQVFPKRFIDHRLITGAGLVSSLSKLLDDFIVQIDGNSGFAALWNDGATFSLTKVIFLFHMLEFHCDSRDEQR